MTTLPRPDLPVHHPQNVPLTQWTQAWLVLEVTHLLNDDWYMMMNAAERETKGYPVTRQEMINSIKEHGTLPAAGFE